ncbi:MAG: tRNA (adenosine(37)-N6)-threonylcarbamoyltransferase complex dimerization subunit type 1 TsaB [Chloroflexi bacterium]|nr:tRNA (adenosine(37)-N6)-threonylcarbamoyltransferase complex dimerization subunit type 1 TsaB [Chloroflexota bacterium]MBV9598919.1 tRNA (adenosine(37)-N6)-threonylcarbamoyltransferase complex dimerization subunit type 1 TsaB [Chloroflexota bacterium]
MTPLLLALDTSTSTASVAVFDGERVLSETTWLAGREHSTRLLIEIGVALERTGRTADDLTGLVVARGPGSYTGVRVALSVAKGMAGGLAIPAWGLGTLDVVALAAEPSELPIRAVTEAGRGRYATAVYANGAAEGDPRLATCAQLVDLVSIPTVVVGEVRADDRESLRRNPNVRLAPLAAAARRAGFLAELGWRLAEAGVPGDARALDAVYVT